MNFELMVDDYIKKWEKEDREAGIKRIYNKEAIIEAIKKGKKIYSLYFWTKRTMLVEDVVEYLIDSSIYDFIITKEKYTKKIIWFIKFLIYSENEDYNQLYTKEEIQKKLEYYLFMYKDILNTYILKLIEHEV